MASEAEVRASFLEQARWCARLGSPFTALLCEVLADTLDRGTAAGARVLNWPGDPAPSADALALRLCGALHALARSGQAPELAALYPPTPLPEASRLREAVAWALTKPALAAWVDQAPQTNEVGRSAVLMAGLLEVAARFGQPIALYELGASAGLNLQLDRYGYDLGGLAAGDSGSAVQLRPDWKGPPPSAALVRIAARRGVDLNPLDVRRDREHMLAYIWPDQAKRLHQAEAALAIAAASPPPIDRADAADWLEQRLEMTGRSDTTQVVMHSVAFQYFSTAAQARIARHIEQVGAQATMDSPLAWLRFEKLPQEDSYSLRLHTWPGGDRLLGWAHPHASSIRWLD